MVLRLFTLPETPGRYVADDYVLAINNCHEAADREGFR